MARLSFSSFVNLLWFFLHFFEFRFFLMAESFRQYIKIRTFLGYRPKEIHLELQDAFGNTRSSSLSRSHHGSSFRWWSSDVRICSTLVKTFSWCNRNAFAVENEFGNRIWSWTWRCVEQQRKRNIVNSRELSSSSSSSSFDWGRKKFLTDIRLGQNNENSSIACVTFVQRR